MSFFHKEVKTVHQLVNCFSSTRPPFYCQLWFYFHHCRFYLKKEKKLFQISDKFVNVVIKKEIKGNPNKVKQKKYLLLLKRKCIWKNELEIQLYSGLQDGHTCQDEAWGDPAQRGLRLPHSQPVQHLISYSCIACLWPPKQGEGRW